MAKFTCYNFKYLKNFTRLFSASVQDLPKTIKIVEVGPRDGLQNEPNLISTEYKLELIRRLKDSGLQTIEATSFVSPKWVPQMKDHNEIIKNLNLNEDVNYPVLVPNLKGLESAIKNNVKEVAVFTAASEGFSQKNTNCSISESLKRIQEVVELAKGNQIRVRGYISCVIGCPYNGSTNPKIVLQLTERLLQLGCYEVSLGDTIGIGTPGSIQHLLNEIIPKIGASQLAIHCHDTYGQALANVQVALRNGITVVDSSIAGLGGCPYAKGATGNLATEDLVYMLHGMGINTGVNLQKLVHTGRWICSILNRNNCSKVGTALKV